MKKILSILLILILGSMLVIGCSNNDENRYSSLSGKDTIASFGTDGRFGIFKLFDDNIVKKDLFDVKDQQSIDKVKVYKDSNPYVYSIGELGYTKINYDNAKIIQSKNLKDFSDSDQQIFKKLENSKK